MSHFPPEYFHHQCRKSILLFVGHAHIFTGMSHNIQYQVFNSHNLHYFVDHEKFKLSLTHTGLKPL